MFSIDVILFELLLLITIDAAKLTASSVTSNTASERNFSLAGHVVSARRSTLISPSVNNILFMNSAIHHTK